MIDIGLAWLPIHIREQHSRTAQTLEGSDGGRDWPGDALLSLVGCTPILR